MADKSSMTAALYKEGIQRWAADALACRPDDVAARTEMFCAMLSGWISVRDPETAASIKALITPPAAKD